MVASMTPSIAALVVCSLVGIAGAQVTDQNNGIASTELIERLGNIDPTIRDAAIAQFSEAGTVVVPSRR
jgi:hypothetical protein